MGRCSTKTDANCKINGPLCPAACTTSTAIRKSQSLFRRFWIGRWLYNKTFNDWPLRKQCYVSPRPPCSLGNFEGLGETISSMSPKAAPVITYLLLYSWRFSRYSAPIHWLVHDHMTSPNETIYRQMPWVGNIAKTRWLQTGKSLLLPSKCWPVLHVHDQWLFVFHPFDPFLLYKKSLNGWSLGE